MGRRAVGAAFSVAFVALASSSTHAYQHRHRGVPLPYPYLLHPDRTPPLNDDYRATVRAAPPAVIKQVDKLRDVGPWLLQCWAPETASGDREITLRVAFARDGKAIGKPRITFVKAASAGEGEALRADLLASLGRCAPLPFTSGLGSAIAGKIFNIRFILKGAASPPT